MQLFLEKKHFLSYLARRHLIFDSLYITHLCFLNFWYLISDWRTGFKVSFKCIYFNEQYVFTNTLVFIYLPRDFLGWFQFKILYRVAASYVRPMCLYSLFQGKSHCRSLPTMLKILSRKRTIYGNRREMSRSSQLAACLGLACKSGSPVLSNTSQNLLKPYLKLDSNSIWSHQWYEYRQHCVG